MPPAEEGPPHSQQPPTAASSSEEPWRRKRPRKSRGKGLRTRTGCLTCRKRHKKCDERQPVCGPCTVSSRHCVFPHDLDAQSALEALTRASTGPLPPPSVSSTPPVVPNGQTHHNQPPPNSIPAIVSHANPSGHPITNGHPTANGHPITSHASGSRPANATEPTISQSPSVAVHSPGIVLPPINDVASVRQGSLPLQGLSPSVQGLSPSIQGLSPNDVHKRVTDSALLGRSPDAFETWSADFASTRWLDLLANDAAQADSGFSLAPSPAADSSDFAARARAAISTHVSPALLNGQAQLPENLDPESERRAWQSDGDLPLTNHEAVLFRHFAEKCALWLDIFDPEKPFSTYAIRLAIKNPGLMKAMLALSAKHRSKSLGIGREVPAQPESRSSSQAGLSDGEDNEWIRYYYETLHYIREALTYSSYTHSEELLATAVVISAYEMLDESDGSGNWQRHLKGVFWIQRSQDVDGGCGGLRMAVWWAWLRQDIWAAFRERRPCLSFWRDKRDVSELTQHELADRAIYLLSQAVNYSAESRKADSGNAMDPATAIQRRRSRDDLVAQMDRWKAYLGEQYNSLPTPKSSKDVFTPLWVHPPQFGVALQAHSFAQILVTLHGPNASGLNGFLKMQKTLADAVNTICGIALELREPSCQIISAQCLYGAGLCVQDAARREKIISMMESCESRVGWAPMATWRDDLRLEWVKVDSETP